MIAGFRTSNDVMEHSKIDKDVQSIECEVAKKTDAGYSAALNTYEKGGAEACSDAVPSQPGSKLGNGGMRTLASFWPGAHKNTAGLEHTVVDEPYNKMYDAYKALNNMNDRDGNGYNPHDEVLYALRGEKEYRANNTPITGSHEFRDQVIKKGIRNQIMMIYAVHELEIAVAAYKDSKLGRTSVKPMLYADVWWAFYAGSMETGSGAGFSAYQNAERRAKFFGTDTASINNGGKSKVKVSLIQGCIEYGKLSKVLSPPCECIHELRWTQLTKNLGRLQDRPVDQFRRSFTDRLPFREDAQGRALVVLLWCFAVPSRGECTVCGHPV